jgi:hypothetical protein
METQRVYAGVDFSAGRRGPTVALLTPRLDLRSLERRTPEAAVEEVASFAGIAVAFGSPLRPWKDGAWVVPPDGEIPLAARRGQVRPADAELKRRGMPARRTPVLESAAPSGMRLGFEMARELAARGFAEGNTTHASPRVLLEVPPAACASVLLGRLPFRKNTLEGRIQRQLMLLRERVVLPDPMDALEELTAHHILSGRLSLDGILGAGELDALLAAFTAWRADTAPDSVTWLGSDADGWICLPVEKLKEKYSK